MSDDLRALVLEGEVLRLLDQRALPDEERWLALTTVAEVAEAIETLAVRGAPAIGGAAALGLAVVARRARAERPAQLRALLESAADRLARTRPTAVNLFFALARVRRAVAAAPDDSAALVAAVVTAAEGYVADDVEACRRIAEHGAALLGDEERVLTICHTGALATCGDGTALGVLKAAARQGKRISVLALETRPLLQGARLTAWECERAGLDVTLLTDGMAGFALARRGVTKAIAGADRIAANGDVANKIGTYGLACLCRHHGVPFYVAAPTSTFDEHIGSGAEIPIEERDPGEVRAFRGARAAPPAVPVWNPAFDVTPSSLVDAIITENGIWERPFSAAARRALLG